MIVVRAAHTYARCDRVGGACGARAIATDRSRAAGVCFATILARRHVCVAMCITLGERA